MIKYSDKIDSNNVNKLMILDNDTGIMEAFSTIFSAYGYEVTCISDPLLALEKLKSDKHDILILSYLIQPFHGDKVVELIREFDKDLYIIIMTAHKDLAPPIETMHNLDIQAYCEKSSNFNELIMLVESGVKYIKNTKKLQDMNVVFEKYYIQFAEVLKNTVEAKDFYTKGHSDRVAFYATLLAQKLNFSDDYTETIRLSGLFHDIGKIGISDSILQKPGKLTDQEYEHIKMHPVIGANILSSSDILKDIIPGVRHHHERYDGTGYPNSLKGEDIPEIARLLAVCDTFDAVTSRRAYRDSLPLDTAIKILNENKNTQFDPKMADAFLEVINKRQSEIIERINSIEEK